MLELPEAVNLSLQIEELLIGKKISNVYVQTHKHKFAFFSECINEYDDILKEKTILSSKSSGGQVELRTECPVITLNDGINLRYFAPGEKRPKKHQLLIEFDDFSAIACSVQMYGAMLLYPDGIITNYYFLVGQEKPSPLAKEFDEEYFTSLLKQSKKNLSAKAFLATEQRIPGLGNGVLQDILFYSKINPKTKIENMTEKEIQEMYLNVKKILHKMTIEGGRNTEKDLYGVSGGYETVLSKNTFKNPCPLCGSEITKEAYLGGSIYYCSVCQPIRK